jgi:6-phosphogluconate dehydrogenase
MKDTRKADFGLTGLAVMGQNLVINVEGRGFTVAVHNRTTEKTMEFVRSRCVGKSIVPSVTIREFVRSVRRPRRIMLMVKAGRPVDEAMEKMMPHLDKGDVLIDGGNSFFRDTDRRQLFAKARGIGYLGCGVSGGEFGALHGPSIMPGGDRADYEKVKDVLLKAAAVTDDGPCCTYLGTTSAGHFVKMVHNGIEYAIMQAIAEVYDIMKTGLGMSVEEIHGTFARWNSGKLDSYLMEISALVTGKVDPATGKALVELIVDSAAQKGTGKWTSQSALDLGVPVSVITAAVDARIISGHRIERARAGSLVRSRAGRIRDAARGVMVRKLENALYALDLIAYAQGMHLLRRASDEYRYGVNLAGVARIWKGGCIVRSKILNVLKDVYRRDPRLAHPALDLRFARLLETHVRDLRATVVASSAAGIPVLCLGSALSYFDSFTRARGPANMIQALRDHFGAHTFEMIDRKGVFHEDWG